MKGTHLELSNSELARMNKMFKGKAKEINQMAQKGLDTVAAQVAVDAKKNIKDNKSIATGQLWNAIFVRPQKDMTTDVAAEVDHAANVEFGQKAGTIVEPSAIYQWLKKKGFYIRGVRGGKVKKGDNFEGALWGVAKKIVKNIAAKGTKAKPFLFPAFRKNEADMMRVIGDAIKKVI